MLQVFVLTQAPMPDPLLDRLRAVSPRVSVTHRTVRTLDELDGATWRGVEVLYTTGLLPAPALATDLRWVQGHFAGVEQLIGHPLLGQVTLTTASGVHMASTSEYVLTMMLAWAHRLPGILHYQQLAEWPAARWELFVPRELRGATVGIVGYGSIGREVARLAHAFGMRTLATKRDVTHTEHAGWQLAGLGDPALLHLDQLYPAEALHDMLSESDYVVLTVPLTPETRELIGAEALRRMKSDAVLINVARGGVIDEAALAEALRAGRIGGAVLDVFNQEPLPSSSPLWHLPNVILSPHVAGFTPHYDTRAMTLFAENLRRYLAGEELLNVVDVSKGY